MTQKSKAFFDRTLQIKTGEARKAVDECIKQYLARSNTERQAAAQTALASVNYIVEMLDPSDHPNWLANLYQDLKFATHNSNDKNGADAVQRIASDHYPKLLCHEWKSSDNNDSVGFDFDPVFEKYRDECRIPELFDELIDYLKQIIDSGKVDSVKALSELNEITATLQNARNGSYFATHSAWCFIAMWLKNTGWELLQSIPIAGTVFKGLQKTLEDTNSQMEKMRDGIQHELEQQVMANFPRLEYHPPMLLRIDGPPPGERGADNEIDSPSD